MSFYIYVASAQIHIIGDYFTHFLENSTHRTRIKKQLGKQIVCSEFYRNVINYYATCLITFKYLRLDYYSINNLHESINLQRKKCLQVDCIPKITCKQLFLSLEFS